MRKKNATVDFRIQALRVPRNMSADTYLRGLIRFMDGGTFPRGLVVELHWRNPETQHGRSRQWQSAAFQDAVEDSSEGFGNLLRGVIMRRLRGGSPRIPKAKPVPLKRKPVKRKQLAKVRVKQVRVKSKRKKKGRKR